MIIVCAWCDRILVNDHDGSRLMSHGICEDCKQKMVDALNKISPDESRSGTDETP